MLITGGEVEGRTGVDVRVAGDRIAEVGAGLDRRGEDVVVDAAGAAVIPALHDHHVHLRAQAAAAGSVPVGPPDVVDGDGLARRLQRAAAAGPPGGWVRAIGYHDSVAGALDRHRLDAIVPDRPVRVQHRSGALWILNTAALATVGAAGGDHPGIERDDSGAPTGLLWRADGWLTERSPAYPLDLAAVSRAAAGWGVAGVTDADPSRTQADVDGLVAAARSGELRQHVMLMSATGLSFDGMPGFAAGARKFLLDDDTLPTVDDLAAAFAAAHDRGEPVAVHCVTRVQLVATLTALGSAGSHPGDRIEHGAVVPTELRADLRRLGVTVVTQPNFVAERGDQYLAEVDPDDLALLYPCAGLQDRGVPVAAGTDAPFGHADPWAAMRAAVHRRTTSGTVVGADERVDAAAALALFLGPPDAPACRRRVRVGEPADLCVLDRPLDRVLAALTDDVPDNPATVTVAAGRIIADNR